MTALQDVLAGVLRYFPNTMIASLFVGGLTLRRLSWILVSSGAALLALFVVTLQYVFGKGFGIGSVPGDAIMEACSLIPISKGATYSYIPSLWISLTSFFAMYILVNAYTIYTTRPTNVSNDALPVQQRKGLGLISMFATAILAFFLIMVRQRSLCETWGYTSWIQMLMGLVGAVVLGGGWAYIWWKILNACGGYSLSDLHGVLLALKPGALHTQPMICRPQAA
jgi:hypothetical protein